MAKSKKLKTGKSDQRDQYTAVLENIYDQNRVFGEALASLRTETQNNFKEINKTLSSHTDTLSSHTEMIGQLMLDVAEIKYELKNKVSYDEFARLEKRVARVETKLR